MGSVLAKERIYTIEEYFALERESEERHEYHNGKIKRMSGGTLPHNQIQTNVVRVLGNWIQENNLDYFIFGSDVKIQIETANRFLYPDAVLICEKPEYYKDRKDTIVNPVLIIEILSASTEKFDQEDKFVFYRSLPSFKEYVTIDQKKPFLQSYFKHEEAEGLWKISSVYRLKDSIRLYSIDFDLPLKKVYYRVPELLGKEWSDEPLLK